MNKVLQLISEGAELAFDEERWVRCPTCHQTLDLCLLNRVAILYFCFPCSRQFTVAEASRLREEQRQD